MEDEGEKKYKGWEREYFRSKTN